MFFCLLLRTVPVSLSPLFFLLSFLSSLFFLAPFPPSTHTCTHTHTHARTHARTHACTHARTHACTHAHTHTHTHRSHHKTLSTMPGLEKHTRNCPASQSPGESGTSASLLFKGVRIGDSSIAHTHSHTLTHHTHTCTHMHTHTHTHSHTTHTHTHTHTHSHTHSHHTLTRVCAHRRSNYLAFTHSMTNLRTPENNWRLTS